MSTSPLHLRTYLTALGLCTALGGVALADDPGVVVLSFEGEMNLSVAARAEVVSIIDRDYEIVTQRAWREALEDEGGSKGAWKRAATATGVTAVIEGTTTKRRAGGALRLRVRDARTGKVIEELTAALDRDGLSEKARSEFEVSLVDALFATGDSAIEELDSGAKPPRLAAEVKVDVAASHSIEPEHRALFEAPRDDGSILPIVAAAPPRPPRQPIADVSLTTFARSRQFGFTGATLPADYPGSTVTGLGLTASVYPMSKPDARHRVNGLGLAASVGTSVSSDVPVQIDDQVFDFPVSQRTWQVNAHYRYPAGAALVDGHIGYGSFTHYVEDIPEDAPLELDLLDAEYGYLDVGGRVEIEAGPRTTLGFFGSYLYMANVGVVTDPDLLGNASAWGMKLGLDLQVQLGVGIYALAGADYRRVSMVFDGDGELYQDVDVDDAKDTVLGGHLDLGIAF
ncbi:MAG: hypothetical protein R3B48_05145 [Kofleriaceae bacterium]